jgi:hypothetical protein
MVALVLFEGETGEALERLLVAGQERVAEPGEEDQAE